MKKLSCVLMSGVLLLSLSNNICGASGKTKEERRAEKRTEERSWSPSREKSKGQEKHNRAKQQRRDRKSDTRKMGKNYNARKASY